MDTLKPHANHTKPYVDYEKKGVDRLLMLP